MTGDPFASGAKLVAYLRDSGGTDQDLSVLQQEAFAQGWCSERGYLLTKIYKDVAHSGSTTVGRDAFQDMVAYLREGTGGEVGVIIWRFNRFSRDIDDAQYFKADLRRRGFDIISLQDNVPQGPEGRLIESIIDWSSQQYLEDMKRDIRRGQRYIATVHHTWPLGQIPFGFKKEATIIGKRRNGEDHIGWRLVPDEKTVPLIRLAFAMRSSGATYSEINDSTHLFCSKAGYYHMFTNPIMIGVLKMKEVTVEDFCEPIVDPETWAAVQEIHRGWSARAGVYQPRASTSKFLLSGLLRCSLCGGAMLGRQTQTPYRLYYYYTCRRHVDFHRCNAPLIPKDQIETLVLDSLSGWFRSPEMLKAIYDQIFESYHYGSTELDAQFAGLSSRLAGITASINRLVAAISVAGHSQAILAELGKLEQEQVELRQALVQLEAKRAKPVPTLSLDQLAAVGEEIAARLKTKGFREQQLLLRSFVKEIRARRLGGHGADVDGEIVLYPPPPIGGGVEAVVPLGR